MRYGGPVSPAGPDTITLRIADTTGAPVLSVDSLAARPISLDKLAPSSLFRLAWEPASGTGDPVTPIAHFHVKVRDGEPHFHVKVPERARAVSRPVLGAIQEALGGEGRRAVVTRGAVSVAGEYVDPALATVWGLVRAAEAENPGRFV